jgi:VanZ family protein
MWLLGVVVIVTIAAVALRRTRWARLARNVSRVAYGLLVLSPLIYFPYRSGFRLEPIACEWTFGSALAVHSLRNFPHVVLFAFFFLLTYAQLLDARRALLWSAAACLAMGLVVEIAQGVTRAGHCRMRDLIPDAVGALAGMILVMTGRRVFAWRKS